MTRQPAPPPAAILPLSLPPRGLSRSEAAAYVGVSPSLFDAMVKDGRMPQPKRINSRTIWDRAHCRYTLDAFDVPRDRTRTTVHAGRIRKQIPRLVQSSQS